MVGLPSATHQRPQTPRAPQAPSTDLPGLFSCGGFQTYPSSGQRFTTARPYGARTGYKHIAFKAPSYCSTQNIRHVTACFTNDKVEAQRGCVSCQESPN